MDSLATHGGSLSYFAAAFLGDDFVPAAFFAGAFFAWGSLAVAFFAGVLTERQKKTQGFSAGARDRVLLITMGNHLDRSQILLAELVNAKPGAIDFNEERTRANDLLVENRLLRLAAARDGETSSAALLDELERVLLDVSHNPATLSDPELEEVQGMLFKVRIIDSNIQEKRQRL